MKEQALVLWEDREWVNLYPLTLSHPTFELRVGILRVMEKWRAYLEAEEAIALTRDYLWPVLQERYPWLTDQVMAAEYWLVNGRALPDPVLLDTLWNLPPNGGVFEGEHLVAARLKRSAWLQFRRGTPLLELVEHRVTLKGVLFTYLWDLIHRNAQEIERDLSIVPYAEQYQPLDPTIKLLGGRVYVGHDVFVDPYVVLDAREGPIFLGNGVRVRPFTYLQGPVAVLQGSLVKAGSRIGEGTTIGPVCKVAGEIEASILQGYSNKQHEGFLGHSYLGEWVNLGAGTNNSDLKNNYRPVRVQLPHGTVDTGQVFVGLMAGDHVKAGINTMFNTGTVVGFGANVFDSGFPPKFIPSFAWGGKQGFVPYDLARFVATARRVMARREVELTAAYQNMIHALYELTQPERRSGV